MKEKLNLTWTGSYYDAEYYYDMYKDKDGREYFIKYESIGLYAEKNPSKNIINDVDWEVVEE